MARAIQITAFMVVVQVCQFTVLFAQETATQTKTGVVRKVDPAAGQIVVMVAGEMTFTVTETTRIAQGEITKTLGDLKVGTRVTLDYSREGDTRTAKRIAILSIEPKADHGAETSERGIRPGGTLVITFPEMPRTFYDLHQEKTVPAQMTIFLPTNYSPEKKFPLLIFLNGGDGGPGSDLGVARSLCEGRDFVCVSMPLFKATNPNAPGAGYIMEAEDGRYMWPFFKTMLEKLEEVVPNIDAAHRILGGFSNGAHATAALIDESHDEVARRFCAILFVEGGGKLRHYDLLEGKPFLMVSSNAKSQPRAKEICDAAKTAGAKATLIVEDVGAHDFPVSAYPAVRSWLRETVAK